MADYYLHPNGICESPNIGSRTKIWAFAHILPGARIGANCNICDHVFIENDVVVGDDVTLKCGVQLWDGIRIGNGVFVGPNATFTNDRFPKSKSYPEVFLRTIVEDGASIGANATILPGIRIGRNAMIGAAAVVTKDVPPNAVITGNPGAIVGYQSDKSSTNPAQRVSLPDAIGMKTGLQVGNCSLWSLPRFSDLRGDLSPLEFSRDLPFVPVRSFLVYGVPTRKVRGEHAHRECHQLLIAAHGRLTVMIDDGDARLEIDLREPFIGLHVMPMVWAVQYKFEPDAVLLVMASLPYDNSDYIRDYSTFLKLKSVNAK